MIAVKKGGNLKSRISSPVEHYPGKPEVLGSSRCDHFFFCFVLRLRVINLSRTTGPGPVRLSYLEKSEVPGSLLLHFGRFIYLLFIRSYGFLSSKIVKNNIHIILVLAIIVSYNNYLQCLK